MTAWLPTIIAAATGLIGAFEPTINTFIAAHPSAAAIIAALAGILTHLAPSPIAQK